ncbi:hypothetical protein ACJX0J_032691, partial [Zea mays]
MVHMYSQALNPLLQKIRSLQIEYQSWWKKEQLSGLKINFHKSELFCYGAAKGSLAMFMFSFFECFATVANVLQHNQLNVAFRRSLNYLLLNVRFRSNVEPHVCDWNINNIPFSKKNEFMYCRKLKGNDL